MEQNRGTENESGFVGTFQATAEAIRTYFSHYTKDSHLETVSV